MSLQFFLKYGFEKIPKQTQARLRVDVEMSFRDIENMMLGCVSETINHLHRQCLMIGKEFHLRI
jgi:hypothetical protein